MNSLGARKHLIWAQLLHLCPAGECVPPSAGHTRREVLLWVVLGVQQEERDCQLGRRRKRERERERPKNDCLRAALLRALAHT